MLGAMVVDSGLDYFGRKSNKAAIIQQDRPDMQLAALETPTSCLVLSGSSQPPIYSVLQKAESQRHADYHHRNRRAGHRHEHRRSFDRRPGCTRRRNWRNWPK